MQPFRNLNCITSEREGFWMSTHQFEAFYMKHIDMVYRLAFTYVKNKADAEEIAQDVFLKYLNQTKSFENENHEKAWLITVTTNLSKNALKTSWIKRVVYQESPETLEGTVATYSQEDETLELILKLPHKYKNVIYLHYYEGYTVEEIATLLNSKVSTIKSQLHRGRALLKPLVEGVNSNGSR